MRLGVSIPIRFGFGHKKRKIHPLIVHLTEPVQKETTERRIEWNEPKQEVSEYYRRLDMEYNDLLY